MVEKFEPRRCGDVEAHMVILFAGGDAPLHILCLWSLILLGVFAIFIAVLARISTYLMNRANKKAERTDGAE